MSISFGAVRLWVRQALDKGKTLFSAGSERHGLLDHVWLGRGKDMKFLCLGYLDIDVFDRAPEATKSAILTECFAQCKQFRATGKVIEEEGLESTSRAKSIRPRNGRPVVTDGPFIETKEQLGSFFIIEADTIEEAVEVASLHPAALMGEHYGFGIEVRPIQM